MALAGDLQRYLSGEPVEARPDRFAYRWSKRCGGTLSTGRAGIPPLLTFAACAPVAYCAASVGRPPAPVRGVRVPTGTRQRRMP